MYIFVNVCLVWVWASLIWAGWWDGEAFFFFNLYFKPVESDAPAEECFPSLSSQCCSPSHTVACFPVSWV